MFSKICFCVAVLVQLSMVNSQCCGTQTCPNDGCCNQVRGFQVQSTSPISPVGLFIVSENQIDGKVSIEGQLPFLGAVALQGELPNKGNADVSYCCGNGEVGITQENASPSGGFGGCGCGCGSLL